MTGGPSSLDLDLDADIGMPPALNAYPHRISLPCFGRGRRFCDLQIPALPKCLLTNSSNTTEATPTPKPGRGRGRSRRSDVRNDKEYRSLSPGGLQDARSISADSRSIHSDQSSRVSDHLQGDHNNQPCQQDSSSASKPKQQNQHEHENQLMTQPIESDTFADVSPHDARSRSSSSLKSDENNSASSALNKVKEHDSRWTIRPPKVIHFDGIPLDCDLNYVHDLLSSYGTIVDWEHTESDGGLTLRMKFSNAEACDLIEMDMDGSDFTGTGSQVRCRHLRN